MKCAKVHLDLGAFVLGGLEPEEAAEIRHHLALCPGCRSELEELEKVSQALEAAPPPAEPPGYLKDEILSRVRTEGRSSSDEEPSLFRGFRFVLPGAAAAVLIVIVALGTFFGLRAESPVATIQLVPTDPNEEYWGVAELHPQPSGNQQVELKLNNLAEPEPGSFYETWFVSGEKHISAGAFTTTGSGETRVWLTVPPEARNYHTMLIAEQSAVGDPAPGEGVVLRGAVS